LRGELLAQRRKAAGWTQAQLAAQLGAAGRLRVGQWERGLEQPQPRYISRLAAALHLDAVELLAVDVENPPLQALRLAAGLTLAEIAAASGMSYSTYYRLENGLVRANPHPETTKALAHTLLGGFFAVTIPFMLTAMIGSTTLGTSLLRRGFRPRATTVLLALWFPLFLALTTVIAMGAATLQMVWAWGIAGWSLATAPEEAPEPVRV
jgi:transcriptional regulator with XRE-family HTH domain